MTTWTKLQKELNLTTDEVATAASYLQRIQDEGVGTYDITPEYKELLDKFEIEQEFNGEYDYEFSEEFAVYATTGKLCKELEDFLTDVKAEQVENSREDDGEDDEHTDDGSGDYLCDCCNEPVNTEDWCFTCKDYVYIHQIND